MALIVKGRLFSKENSVICIPIVDTSYEDIIESARTIAANGIEMAEWRADFFSELMDTDRLADILLALKSIFSRTIFLVTLRSSNQGGNLSISTEELQRFLLFIGQSRCPDLIDVEYFSHVNPQALIRKIQGNGVNVIASYHDKGSPASDVCFRLLETIYSSDPDIIKLSVTPKSSDDVFELGRGVTLFNREHHSTLAITGMGKYSKMTRVFPEEFCSSINFSYMEKPSCQGQIKVDKFKKIRDLLT